MGESPHYALRSPHCALRSPQMCTKKEVSLWTYFSTRTLNSKKFGRSLVSRIIIKKYEKKQKKRTQTPYPKGLSHLQKKASAPDDNERGTVFESSNNRPKTARRKTFFFDARALRRENHRDVFLLGRALERSAFIASLFEFGGVPPTPWGSNFQSKRRRRFRSPSRDERRANRRAATRANRQRCARVRANG